MKRHSFSRRALMAAAVISSGLILSSLALGDAGFFDVTHDDVYVTPGELDGMTASSIPTAFVTAPTLANPYIIGGFNYGLNYDTLDDPGGPEVSNGGVRPPGPRPPAGWGNGKCEEAGPNGPRLVVECPADLNWNTLQRKYACDKIRDIDAFRGSLVLTHVHKGPNARRKRDRKFGTDRPAHFQQNQTRRGKGVENFGDSKARGAYPPVGSLFDIDHIVELQLGGLDSFPGNLRPMDFSVNRSFGSQIDKILGDFKDAGCWGMPIDGIQEDGSCNCGQF